MSLPGHGQQLVRRHACACKHVYDDGVPAGRCSGERCRTCGAICDVCVLVCEIVRSFCVAAGLWLGLKFVLQDVSFKIMVIGKFDQAFLDLRQDKPDNLPENARLVASARVQAVTQHVGSARVSRNMHGSH